MEKQWRNNGETMEKQWRNNGDTVEKQRPSSETPKGPFGGKVVKIGSARSLRPPPPLLPTCRVGMHQPRRLTSNRTAALRATVVLSHLAQDSRFGIELAQEPRLGREPYSPSPRSKLGRGGGAHNRTGLKSLLGEEGLQPARDIVVIRTMRVGHLFDGDQPLVDVARVRAGEN